MTYSCTVMDSHLSISNKDTFSPHVDHRVELEMQIQRYFSLERAIKNSTHCGKFDGLATVHDVSFLESPYDTGAMTTPFRVNVHN